ncbi:hypothetical protein TTHERM_00250930 (macronuclear) [Tetrahymena thermophila SB210]|uniref:Uncharacterized protein n=1 Tax=Tetrahymena thermophila (strain SB210) TaxID=312017 RepID=Q23QU0_TETTS|nr:hypothetical protein TTHERM_00250930 [Tetrahymena thermophila SB210]EAR98798.3 hypothetical protein TTHERM_00250930 [Tetrahymena thermophila SB210]|eukprot:XP_001019043.3 hypothetical protein TTHERM_00250930 [Tetrahymena thermophila SB210]
MIRQVKINPTQDIQNPLIKQLKTSSDTFYIPNRSSSSEFIRTIKQNSPEQVQHVSPIQYINSTGYAQLKQNNAVSVNQVVAAPGQNNKHRSLSPCNQSQTSNQVNMVFFNDSIQNMIHSPLSSTSNSFYSSQNNQQNQNQKKAIQIQQQQQQLQNNVNKSGTFSPAQVPLQPLQINNNQINQQQVQQNPGIQLLKGQQIQQNIPLQKQTMKLQNQFQVQSTQQNDQMVFALGGKVNDLSQEIQRLLSLNEKLIQEALSWRQKFELCNMRKQILEQELEQRKLMVKTYSQNLLLNDEATNMNDTNEKLEDSCQSSDHQDAKNYKKAKKQKLSFNQSEQDIPEDSQASENQGYTEDSTEQIKKKSSKNKKSNKDYNFQHIVKQISSLENLKKMNRVEDLHQQIQKLIEENQILKQQMRLSGSSDEVFSDSSFVLDEQEEEELRKQQINTEEYYKKMSLKEKIKWKITSLSTRCAKLEKELTESKVQSWNLQKQLQSYDSKEDMRGIMLQKYEQEKSTLPVNLPNKILDQEYNTKSSVTQQKQLYQFLDGNNIFYHQQTNQLTPKSSTNLQPSNQQYQVNFNFQQGSPKTMNNSNNNKHLFNNQHQNSSLDQQSKQEGSEYRYHSDQNKTFKKNDSSQDQKSSTSSNSYAKEIIEKAINYAGERYPQINNPSQSVKTIEYNYSQSFQLKSQSFNSNSNTTKQQIKENFINSVAESSKQSESQNQSGIIPVSQLKNDFKLNNMSKSPNSDKYSEKFLNTQKQVQQQKSQHQFLKQQKNDENYNNKTLGDLNCQATRDDNYNFSNLEITTKQYQSEMQKLAEKQKQQLQKLQEKVHAREVSIIKENELMKQESGSKNKFNYEFQNIKKISANQKANILQYNQNQQSPQSPLSEFQVKCAGGSVNRYQQNAQDVKSQNNQNTSLQDINFQNSETQVSAYSKMNTALTIQNDHKSNPSTKSYINCSKSEVNIFNSGEQRIFDNNDDLYASANSESFRVNHSFSDKENQFSSRKKSFQQQLSPQFVYQSNDSFQPNNNY